MSDENSTVEMIGGVSLDQVSVVTKMNVSFSSASIAATAIGSLMFLYIRLKFPRLSDRVTFRLAFATMVSDLFYAAFQLLLNSQTEDTPLCTFILWGFTFFSLLTIFFPTCIAINLQATFINEHEHRGRRNLEKYYFLGSIILSIVLSFLPFAEQMYGWDIPEGICWYRDSGTRSNIIWQWTVLYAWEVGCVLYIITILLIVVTKLRRISTQLVESTVSGKTMTSQYERNVLKNKAVVSAVVRRIMWYPIVPLITQTVNFLVETDVYINKRVSYALLIVSTLNTLQGVLNAFAFLQDIAVNRAYRSTKLAWWTDHVNKYEKSYPHLSRNKSFNPLINPDVGTEVKKDEGEQQSKQKQPSFGERVRYILLTTLFSQPKDSDAFIDYDPYYYGGKDEEVTMQIYGKTEMSAVAGNNGDETEHQEFNKNVLSQM